MRKFAAVSAFLDAADRHADIGSAEAVNEHAARVQTTGDPLCLSDIGGLQIAVQAIVAGVGEPDRTLKVICDRQPRHRTERLLVEVRHSGSDIGEDGRGVGVPWSLDLVPAQQQRCALCQAALNPAVQFRAKILARHGTNPEFSLARLTEPFKRLEPSRARRTGGVGLGLSIVQALTQRYRGDLMLENRAEGGFRAILLLRSAGASETS